MDEGIAWRFVSTSVDIKEVCIAIPKDATSSRSDNHLCMS
jgi:hypothetical protein